MNIINWLTDNWKGISEVVEVMATNVIAFYSFICAHGGLIPMWNKFLGNTPTTTTVTSGATSTHATS